MNELIQWGLGVVQWIQTFRNPVLDQFFLTINVLGDEQFYLLFFPLIFWCISKPIGYRLAFVFLLGEFAKESLKEILAQPRPYQVDKNLWAPVKQSGFGIPSGHTSSTVITWGNLATQLKKPVWWGLAIAVPLAVGTGRMYLADHFPQDVIAGALLGITFVVGYAFLQPRAALWLNTRASLPMKLALATLAPILLALLHFSDNTTVSIGALFGFSIGLILEEEYVHYSPRGEWWKQVLKFALGFAVAMGLRFGLKTVLGDAAIATTLRYAVIGFWFAFGAPWVFVMARLAMHEK